MYEVIVLADSVTKNRRGRPVRVTTLQVTFPRFILAEFNTHRLFSRNSASSRAIPVKNRVKQVRETPFVPESFGKNKSGMQAAEVLSDEASRKAEEIWLRTALHAAQGAEDLDAEDVKTHKQHANRVIEPWAWHTVVVTSTYWENFFALRAHPAAQPEMQITARMMKAAMDKSTPRELGVGDWHIPYLDAVAVVFASAWERERMERGEPPVDVDVEVMISVARCAAVSYERQTMNKSIDGYVQRHDELKGSGHWSPFEHQVKVANDEEVLRYAHWKCTNPELYGNDSTTEPLHFEPDRIGNLEVPWLQYRKMIPGEDIFQG